MITSLASDVPAGLSPHVQLVIVLVLAALSIVGNIAVAFIAPALGRRAANKTAEANADNATAAVHNATTEAFRAANDHWARYNEAMQRWNEHLSEEISKNTKRIEDAELRSQAAEVRAQKAENLYSTAIVYMRRVVRWLSDNLPGEDWPKPPTELNVDL